MLTLSGAGQGQNSGSSVETRFVITVKTDNTGTSADNQFTLPWIGTYDVDWGDGNVDTGVTDEQTHTYATAGTYDVAVTAETGQIRFNNGGDRLKLLDIKNWGTCAWTNMNTAFRGCINLTSVTATDAPNLNIANSLNFMFWRCRLLNADFSSWDVSNITDTSFMFSSGGANGTINLSNWDVSNVTNMSYMFYDCTNLIPIGVEDWDTQSLLNALDMFKDTDLFNQSLANWDINQVTNFTGFMRSTPGLSTANYDATLISWASQSPQNNINISFGNSQYSYEGRAARQSLIDNFGWTIVDGGEAVRDEFIITVKTDNAGTSASNQFTIPTRTVGTTQAFLYDIETSDGQTIIGVTGDTTITFPSAGTYDIFISGSFPYMYFSGVGDRLKLLDIKNFGIYALGSTRQEGSFRGCSNMVITATDSGNFGSVTLFGTTNNGAWADCSSLTSFPLIDTSSGTDFVATWRNCTSLTSFPLIDTSSGTNFGGNFNGCWENCSSLTSFPSIDTSNGTNFFRTWAGCSGLTSFPLIDTSSGTGFSSAWRDCSSLTSFPLLDTSSGISFGATWQSCSSLTSFPANAFDTNIATIYPNAFLGTALTTQSIDDILLSLDTSGVSNGTFTQSGGNAPSATGQAAIVSLVAKGWTVTVTGGYTPPQLLLDQYPNAAAAYSLRELSTAFVGQPVVRVRRSSDNAEQDFTSVEITDGTLTTFTGANDGFVTIWYDQSGNGNNYTQTIANEQPKLVSIGVVELENGKPTILFDGVNDSFVMNSKPSTSRLDFYQVYHNTKGNMILNNGNVSTYCETSQISGSTQLYAAYGSPSYRVNSVPQTWVTRTNVYNALSFSRLLQTTNNADISGWVAYRFSKLIFSGFTLGGNVQELVYYDFDQELNNLGIETNINTEYTIY